MKRAVSVMLAGIISVVLCTAAVAEGIAISNYAGGAAASWKDGKALDATFNQPYGMAMDVDGGLLVVVSLNNRIRKVKDGEVTTIAGFSEKDDSFGFPEGGYADGDALKAKFNKPRDVVVDSKGNIFVSDTGNNVIRKIAGGKVFTFAGSGVAGYEDGPGPKARFNSPSGLAIDRNDNIYVADTLNHVIRKITPKGEVSTYAGKYADDGGYEEGLALDAMFVEPSDIDIDSGGVLYILDSGNQLVRKLEKGTVTTLAGIRGELIPDTYYAQGGFANGKCAEAKFNFPKGIDVLDDGTVFVADTWNHRIRVIKPDGNVATVTGTGLPGKNNGSVEMGELNAPVGVLYVSGNLYISDMWNNSIRVISAEIGALQGVEDRTEIIKGIRFKKDQEDIQVWFNKRLVSFPDAKPFIENTKVYLPVRFVCEKWGAEVLWDDSSKQVEIRKGEFKMILTPGSGAAFIKDDRTMMDTVNLARATGLRVEWFPEYNAVVIVGR